jgi:hypothetical protein
VAPTGAAAATTAAFSDLAVTGAGVAAASTAELAPDGWLEAGSGAGEGEEEELASGAAGELDELGVGDVEPPSADPESVAAAGSLGLGGGLLVSAAETAAGAGSALGAGPVALEDESPLGVASPSAAAGVPGESCARATDCEAITPIPSTSAISITRHVEPACLVAG